VQPRRNIEHGSQESSRRDCEGNAEPSAVLGPFLDLEVRPGNDDRTVDPLAIVFGVAIASPAAWLCAMT
jgi:hypothetical protein